MEEMNGRHRRESTRPVPRGGPCRGDPAACAIVALMPERPADLVFTGGHVHTVDARQPRAEAVASTAIGSPRVGQRGRDRGADRRRRHASSTSRAGCSCRASRTPTSIRCRAAWIGCSATCARPRVARRCSRRSAPTPTNIRRSDWIVGSGWYMGDFPGRHAATRGSRRDPAGSARLTSRIATATRPG